MKLVPLLTPEQVKTIEEEAITKYHLTPEILMEHAAMGVVKRLQSRFKSLLSQLPGIVVAGTGNNGADALAAARILHLQYQVPVTIVLSGDLRKASKLFHFQHHIVKSLEIPIFTEISDKIMEKAAWVLDGLFGTGLNRDVEGNEAALITKLNQRKNLWIVAIDIPSGLNASKGTVQGIAIEASETVTFGYVKRGLLTGAASDHIGKLSLHPIPIRLRVSTPNVETWWYRFPETKDFPKRKPSGHKGNYGHVYVRAGSDAMLGASVLAARSALQAGSGWASLWTEKGREKHIRATVHADIMIETEPTLFEKNSSVKRVFLIGPGMGFSAETKIFLASALESRESLVLDGDALTLLAQDDKLFSQLAKRKATTILTPHPKEAALLLDKTTDQIQSDRFAACRNLVDKTNAVIILKGNGTLVSTKGDNCYVINRGNSGLSKAGSGDILAGLVASLLGQGLPPISAATLGAYLHGAAAERFLQEGNAERTLTPEQQLNLISRIITEGETQVEG